MSASTAFTLTRLRCFSSVTATVGTRPALCSRPHYELPIGSAQSGRSGQRWQLSPDRPWAGCGDAIRIMGDEAAKSELLERGAWEWLRVGRVRDGAAAEGSADWPDTAWASGGRCGPKGGVCGPLEGGIWRCRGRRAREGVEERHVFGARGDGDMGRQLVMGLAHIGAQTRCPCRQENTLRVLGGRSGRGHSSSWRASAAWEGQGQRG